MSIYIVCRQYTHSVYIVLHMDSSYRGPLRAVEKEMASLWTSGNRKAFWRHLVLSQPWQGEVW